MSTDRAIRTSRAAYLTCLAVVLLSMAACGGSSGSSTAAVASPTPAPSSAAPTVHASHGHCALTPGAKAAATVTWNVKIEGGNPKVKADQAVAFVTTARERP